jgi:uncharacterized protein (TIGR02391 family)
MPPLPKLRESHLREICNALGDAATHREFSILFRECGVEEKGGSPKWERMLLALAARQQQDGCGNNVVNFISAVVHPARFRDLREQYAEIRANVNYCLAFYGIAIGEDGKARPAEKAQTLSEAEERASELRAELRNRFVQDDVMRFCRAELLDQNYFHCVLEASKSLAQKIRDKTGLQGDGAELVDAVFSVKNPILAINSLETEPERSEQKGVANLLKGIFGIFRNVPAHAPKIHWAVNKRDALDALTIISYAHR